MLYADQRWIGNHGIGRFARHVLAGLTYCPVSLTSHPAAPLDSWRLTRALLKAAPNDLFFSPGYNTPLFCPSPFVFTIHDLSHVYCPENSSPLIRLYYATYLKRACHRAVRILTVSEFTRGQIVSWSGVPMNKVLNVGCGVDPAYHPGNDPNRLPFPYIFSVSNRKRHKNELRMIEAFAKSEIDKRIHLVFTGSVTAKLARWIERQGVTSRVDFLGSVSEGQLPSLYRNAQVLLFTSLYEGFGLPLLEAMACGTPVVTSNVTAMPETAGGAAILVEPRTITGISQAIQQVIEDASLRVQLQQRGLARAAEFSWTKTSIKVHELLLAV